MMDEETKTLRDKLSEEDSACLSSQKRIENFIRQYIPLTKTVVETLFNTINGPKFPPIDYEWTVDFYTERLEKRRGIIKNLSKKIFNHAVPLKDEEPL